MYVTHSQKNKNLHKRHHFWKIFLLVASLHLAIIFCFFLLHAFKKPTQPKTSYFQFMPSSSSHEPSDVKLHADNIPKEMTKKAEKTNASSFGIAEESHSKFSSNRNPIKSSQRKHSVADKELKRSDSLPQLKHTVVPDLTEVTRKIPTHPKTSSLEEKGNKNQNLANNESVTPGSESGDYERYYLLIREKLYSLWDQPVEFLGLGLSATIEMIVESNGKVRQFKLLQSSGNEKFDQSALEAVKKLESIGEPRPSSIPEVITVKFQMAE
jgi:protein TonB